MLELLKLIMLEPLKLLVVPALGLDAVIVQSDHVALLQVRFPKAVQAMLQGIPLRHHANFKVVAQKLGQVDDAPNRSAHLSPS